MLKIFVSLNLCGTRNLRKVFEILDNLPYVGIIVYWLSLILTALLYVDLINVVYRTEIIFIRSI